MALNINKLERFIYENYLLVISKESRLKWNATELPTKLKLMAIEIIEHIKNDEKK